MTDGHTRWQQPEAVGTRERPVLPTGALRRTGRLAVLPLRHAAHSAAAASRLSRTATDQVAARTAEQLFATFGELKGGAAKLGQAMSVFEAAMPEEVAAPYRSALRRLTDAAPAMPAEVARRVVAADLTVAYGPGWQERLMAFDDKPAAAASIGQVHRGRWRDDGGQIVEVAVKVQYPGVGKALRSDLRQARLSRHPAGLSRRSRPRRARRDPPGVPAVRVTRGTQLRNRTPDVVLITARRHTAFWMQNAVSRARKTAFCIQNAVWEDKETGPVPAR